MVARVAADCILFLAIESIIRTDSKSLSRKCHGWHISTVYIPQHLLVPSHLIVTCQPTMSAALGYRFVTFGTMTSHDGGSKADANLQVWRPDREYSYYRAFTNDIDFSVAVPDGWFYLGQSWSSNDTAPQALIVHALAPDALTEVASWERVWTDTGSGRSWNFALWRGVPPNNNYVVVGGVFIRSPKSSGYPAPDWDQAHNIKAVRKDLVVKDLTLWVWDDNGVGADSGGSVWRTTGFYGVPPNVIIPSEGHGQVPPDICFSLNRSKVISM